MLILKASNQFNYVVNFIQITKVIHQLIEVILTYLIINSNIKRYILNNIMNYLIFIYFSNPLINYQESFYFNLNSFKHLLIYFKIKINI